MKLSGGKEELKGSNRGNNQACQGHHTGTSLV